LWFLLWVMEIWYKCLGIKKRNPTREPVVFVFTENSEGLKILLRKLG
jgi:hypothetical protein